MTCIARPESRCTRALTDVCVPGQWAVGVHVRHASLSLNIGSSAAVASSPLDRRRVVSLMRTAERAAPVRTYARKAVPHEEAASVAGGWIVAYKNGKQKQRWQREARGTRNEAWCVLQHCNCVIHSDLGFGVWRLSSQPTRRTWQMANAIVAWLNASDRRYGTPPISPTCPREVVMHACVLHHRTPYGGDASQWAYAHLAAARLAYAWLGGVSK